MRRISRNTCTPKPDQYLHPLEVREHGFPTGVAVWLSPRRSSAAAWCKSAMIFLPYFRFVWQLCRAAERGVEITSKLKQASFRLQ